MSDTPLHRCPRCVAVLGALMGLWTLLAFVAVGRWRDRIAQRT